MVALVEKGTLMRHLASLGWTMDLLDRKQARIRKAAERGGREPLGDIRTYGIRFHYTDDKAERPINAMLSRKTYRRLALFNKCYPTTQFAKAPKQKDGKKE